MAQISQSTANRVHKVGRPRRGTERERENALLDAATHVFLRGGYVSTSIQTIAREAGVSTRTIYDRFKNKGELLCAVVSRLVDNDVTGALSAQELRRLNLEDALLHIGRTIAARLSSPTVIGLLRLLVTETRDFPELALRMRERTKDRIDNAVEKYFRGQMALGTLTLPDPTRAASLFTQMINGELKDGVLFGSARPATDRELQDHVAFAVQVFLRGALPRPSGKSRKGNLS